ncbi:hypothetical protein TA3x_001989 [Tundrisphaera sp. TA3]|uniref:hypothetical protein n=1 Tax=Tundrisphaera sp. TA3 TaxID=3435775 RepID=UPI003EBCC165
MNCSDLVSQYLSPVTRKAYAESQKPDASEPRHDSPLLDAETRHKLYAEHGPSLLAKDIQTRIHDLIFGGNLKTLDEAKQFHQLLIDSLDADRDAAKKNSR